MQAESVRALATIITDEAERAGRNWHPQTVGAVVGRWADDDPNLSPFTIVEAARRAIADPDARTPGAMREWAPIRPGTVHRPARITPGPRTGPTPEQRATMRQALKEARG